MACAGGINDGLVDAAIVTFLMASTQGRVTLSTVWSPCTSTGPALAVRAGAGEWRGL